LHFYGFAARKKFSTFRASYIFSLYVIVLRPM
jgi:hypothetical protein